jgi:hypothetical protein
MAVDGSAEAVIFFAPGPAAGVPILVQYRWPVALDVTLALPSRALLVMTAVPAVSCCRGP